MTAWVKLAASGSLVIEAGTVLQTISKSAPSAFPAITDTPDQSIAGPGTQILYVVSGTDLYVRTQPADVAAAQSGADPTMDSFAEVKAAVDALTSGKAPTSRNVLAGGLATGGGNLTADRTITVAKSSQAQAQAGTDDATAMTPLRTFDAIAAYIAALPTVDPHVVGKAWNNAGTLKVSAG